MADLRALFGSPPLKILLFMGIIISSSWCSEEKTRPTKTLIENWATHIDHDLWDLNKIEAPVIGHYRKDKVEAETYGGTLKVELENINELELVKEMAQKLSEMLGKKTKALRETVRVAEDFAAEYSFNETIRKDDIGYKNSKELKQNNNTILTFEDRFEKEVNYSFSGVHIPVEIFDGDKDILNGLNWTAALDAQFMKNAENDPEILWQYFGSQSGFMRTYPATPWPRKKVDLYDVRRQSWYTQGSSSPKDMMILIDKSGSTHGQSLQLMQNAVKSILDTLGENDFVNIVQFAEEASFVSRCFNHTPFVQANYRNKKQLERDVDGLEASGQADFSNALKFAFEKFQEFSENETTDDENIGANCNKVIMLLTDGGTDNAEEVFRKYNWNNNKTVRVFTYAVGPTPNPVHAIRWMACANRGYFSTIPAMGAIRARVQNYELVLSRDKALARSRDAQWTSCEYNTFREWDKQLGLGMMTTVTLPVYNTSSSSSNQTILGVVGIDVTTAQLEARTPFEKIGPIGYSFAINPNGYVVFHPNLKTSGKYMTEPPNVDILDLEIDEENPEMNELRQEMINRKNGQSTIASLFLSPDRRYVSYDNAAYAYTSIKDTTFSLGLSVPTFKKKYFKFTKLANLDWSYVNQSSTTGATEPAFKVLIAPWNYFKNMTKISNLTGYIQDVLNLLKSHPSEDDWNLDMLYHLYWDTKLVREVEAFNSSKSDSEMLGSDGTITTKFVITSGGMTYVKPASDAQYFEAQRDPRESSLFTRAQHAKKCILSSDYSEDNTTTSGVTIACAVPFVDNGQVVDKPAVVGQRYDHSFVINKVHTAIEKVNRSTNLMTCRDEGLVCYVLDNGGFLVAGNVENPDRWIGRFIGEVDPTVFAMLNGTVYSMSEQYHFQSTCKIEKPTASAGFSSIRIPSMNLLFDMLNIGWWSRKATWALTSFSLYSWMSPEVTVMADDDEEDDRKCVKAFTQYFIKNNKTETFEHTTFCGTDSNICKRQVTAVYLENLTSLFVVTTPQCDECEDEVVMPSPHEVSPEEAENIVCAMAQTPRTRLRSYACYHSDKREDDTECGCSGLYLSPLMLAVVLVSVLWQLASLQR